MSAPQSANDQGIGYSFFPLSRQNSGIASFFFMSVMDFVKNGGSVNFVLFGSSNLDKCNRALTSAMFLQGLHQYNFYNFGYSIFLFTF